MPHFDPTQCEVLDTNLRVAYEPVLLIAVYRGLNREAQTNQHMTSYFLEQHPISPIGGQFVTGAGQPLKKEQLQEIGNYLVKEQDRILPMTGEMGARLLYYRPSSTSPFAIWHSPAGKRELRFSSGMKLKDKAYDLPGMIFIGHGHGMSCFMIDDTQATTREELLQRQIFYCPLPNVSNNGSVCLGSSSRLSMSKASSIEEMLQAAEGGFWHSQFTHLSSPVPLPEGRSIIEMLREASEGIPCTTAMLAPHKHSEVILSKKGERTNKTREVPLTLSELINKNR